MRGTSGTAQNLHVSLQKRFKSCPAHMINRAVTPPLKIGKTYKLILRKIIRKIITATDLTKWIQISHCDFISHKLTLYLITPTVFLTLATSYNCDCTSQSDFIQYLTIVPSFLISNFISQLPYLFMLGKNRLDTYQKDTYLLFPNTWLS